MNRWLGGLRPYWIIGIALLVQAAPLSGKSNKPSGPALLEAAKRGDREAVRAALEYGTDVNTRDGKRATPLILAANGEHAEVVKLLIAKGAKVNAVTQTRSTALLETLSGLADRKEAEDDTKPMEEVPAPSVTPKETAQIVDLLLAAGADVKSRDEFGNTPLSMAVELGQVSLIRVFLEHGADPNAPGIDGEKPLNTAVEIGKIDVVRLLLDSGADPNGKDEWGFTPLKTIDNALQFARNKMPASWDPKGELTTRMEAIRDLIQTAGGRDSQDLGEGAQTRFFKSLLSHLPEQERTSFAKTSTPQVLYFYGVKVCESLGKGATRTSLIEGNLDQFFSKSLADAIFEAATETICPKAASHS